MASRDNNRSRRIAKGGPVGPLFSCVNGWAAKPVASVKPLEALLAHCHNALTWCVQFASDDSSTTSDESSKTLGLVAQSGRAVRRASTKHARQMLLVIGEVPRRHGVHHPAIMPDHHREIRDVTPSVDVSVVPSGGFEVVKAHALMRVADRHLDF